MKSEGIVAPAKTELAARLAFMESSIDAAVGKGAISQVNADMLKERIEAQVFQPRPPQSLQFSKECWRRPNFDHPRRLNLDQGAEAVAMTAICG